MFESLLADALNSALGSFFEGIDQGSNGSYYRVVSIVLPLIHAIPESLR